MTKTKKLTLKEVSAALGVSTATISNAFNRPDQLSAALREKILKEAAELGYHGPNLAARSLRRGESGVIGVMLADSLSYSFSDPMANQLLQGIAEVLVEKNKQLLLLSSDTDSQEQSSAESLPDGFIFYGAPTGNSFERIVKRGKPVVAVDFQQDQVSSVNIDNYQAAYDAAEMVLKNNQYSVAVLGMRIIDSDRVCRLISSDLKTPSNEISRQRLMGYVDAAQAAGVPVSSDGVWHIPINIPEMAEQAAREALTMSPRPDVLLCMSDVIALAAMRVASSLEISIPEQLKVVGFDDIPEASRSVPPLTTVCQQSKHKGRAAAELLLEGGDTHKNEVLETTLRKRQST